MGVISDILSIVFGSNRNVLRETAEVFRENAEAGAMRGHDSQIAALTQMQAEFNLAQRGGFDRVMDGVNRVPRPALALGTLGLMISAMANPVWFAERMQGVALVPDPLWWLLGVIVSFYFGARQQVVRNIAALRALAGGPVGTAATRGAAADEMEVIKPGENPALVHWNKTRRGGAA